MSVQPASSPNDYYGAWGAALAQILFNMRATAEVLAGTYDEMEKHQARARETSWEQNIYRVDIRI